jgi:transposase
MRARRIYRRYEATFREDALSLLRRSDRTLFAVARDLGVPASTLEGWYRCDMVKRKKTAAQARKLPVGDPTAEHPDDKIARLEREVSELRGENEALRQDRAILKKAAAFFAKESE